MDRRRAWRVGWSMGGNRSAGEFGDKDEGLGALKTGTMEMAKQTAPALVLHAQVTNETAPGVNLL